MGVTVTVTVATEELTAPSLAVKVNVSTPTELVLGKYVIFGGVPDKVPRDGLLTIVYVSESLSASVAAKTRPLAVSSEVDTD